MSMDIYTPSENDIIHETAVDLKGRKIEKTIHLVQYDKKLSIISVKLMSDGDPYTLPLDYDIWLRWSKKDHTYVRKKCMISQDRKNIYFDVDYQMTYYHGDVNPILEIISSNNNGSAGTSAIPISIDKNPIQEGDVESQTEDPIWDRLEEQIIELNLAVEFIEENYLTKEEAANYKSIYYDDTLPLDPSKIKDGDLYFDEYTEQQN